MPAYLHITAVPQGEAPLWVREQWVGLSLPLAKRGRQLALGAGVLSGPQGWGSGLVALLTGRLMPHTGYIVEAAAAIAVLETTSQEAALWWRENTPYLFKGKRYLVFQDGVGRVVEA